MIVHDAADSTQLLVYARTRKGEAPKILLDSLAGIVFLGTPHLRERNRLAWGNAVAILELRTPTPAEALSNDDELRQLFRWSQDFENLRLVVSILSTTERRKSKKKRRMKLSMAASESVCIVVRKHIPGDFQWLIKATGQ